MMKRYSFFTLFIVLHLGFIFLQIHKHMRFIKESFSKQKNERLLANLTQQKQDLLNQLYAKKSRASIKQFAKNKGLKSLKLARVKRIQS